MDQHRPANIKRPGAGRSAPVRPQRAAGLTAPVVGIVLSSSGTLTTLLNNYLTVVHVAVGVLVMAFGLIDILQGGPTRPAIIPVAGAYMASAVVFFAAMQNRQPKTLAWTLGLADAVMLTAAYKLTVVNVLVGPAVTFAILACLVLMVYSAYGMPRVVMIVAAMTTCMFVVTGPAAAYAISGRLPHLSDVEVACVFILAVGVIVARFTASEVRTRTTAKVIERLQRLDYSISMHHTAARRLG